MRLEIRMPKLSEYSDVGVIAKWRVAVGDTIRKGDAVADVELDMTRTEILAQADGKIAEIWVHAGQKVPVETVIAMQTADDVVATEEPVAEEPPQETDVPEAPVDSTEDDFEYFPELGDETNPYVEPGSETTTGSNQEPVVLPGQILASPDAIQLAEQFNINLGTLVGTGSCGLIERADVEAAMQTNSRFVTAEDVDELMSFDGDFASKLPYEEQAPPVPVNEFAPTVTAQTDATSAEPVDESTTDDTDEVMDVQIDVPTEEPAPSAEVAEETFDAATETPEVAAEAQEVATPSPDVIFMDAGPESADETEALAVDESDTILPDEQADVEAAEMEEPEADAAAVEQFVEQSATKPLRKSVKVRRLVARKMQESWRHAPHFFVTVAVDMTDVIRFRTDLGVTINDFILAATARTLQEHPWVNSHFINDEAVEQPAINISMAVESEQGLYYPVLKDCAGKSLKELGLCSAEMVVKAHAGKLTEEDMDGGSFTVSNMGMLGVESCSAIITPPQVAVLAVGTVQGEVVIDEYEEMVMAPMVRLTLSGDHRALDGADAADFLGTMKSYLEAPITLVAPQEN